MQPYKQEEKRKKELTNAKECRIINKLTRERKEKPKKRASKKYRKGLSEPEGFQRIPDEERRAPSKEKVFLKNLLTKQTRYGIILKLSHERD